MFNVFDASSFVLSEAENEDIFRNLIWPILISNTRTSLSPRAVFVGGQPASGKTGIRATAIQELGGIIIDGDDLRPFHPQYDLIKRREPLRLTACTGPDSARWIQKCIAAAIDNQISVAVETTMRSPNTVIDTIKRFKAHGFDVEVNVVAVKPMITWRRCCFRRELMLKSGTAVRNVSKEIHDAAAVGVLKAITAIEREGLAPTTRIYDFEGRIIYDAQRTPGRSVEGILREEHGRHLTLVEALAHDSTWSEITEMMKAREAARSEIDEITEYRDADARENNLK